MNAVQTETPTRERDAAGSPYLPGQNGQQRNSRRSRPESRAARGPEPGLEPSIEPGPEPDLDLAGFIETYQESIARAVAETYRPRYQPGSPGARRELPRLLRQPLGAQEHAIRGAALSLKLNPGTIIVGEMGTGKTYIAIADILAGCRNILVIVPPHLVQKWKREIEITIPQARPVIVRTLTDLKQLRPPDPRAGPRFTIMSREAAKLSYRWEPAVVRRQIDKGKRHAALCCPDCFQELRDPDNIPLTQAQLERRKHHCPGCRGALWQPKREKHRSDCPCRACTGQGRANPRYRHRKYALADYVQQRLKGRFDLLIADEVHEYKGRGTAQGIAGGNLAQACRRILTLTGTLAGGYSSTLFHLLYRFTPELRQEFGHNELSRWIDRYGFRQTRYRSSDPDDSFADGRSSRRRSYRKTEKETPGLAPAALFHLIGNSVFLRLSDISAGLPPYQEEIQIRQLRQQPAAGAEHSQQTAYAELYRKLKEAMLQALREGSARLLAAYLQSLLAYPDGCTRGETVIDPVVDATGQRRVIVDLPPLDPQTTYPKEQALIDLIREEKRRGRRTLVYTTHTDTRDLTGRTPGTTAPPRNQPSPFP